MPFYEIGSALLCSSLISPVMTIMDVSIIRSQFENMGLRKAAKETIRSFRNGSTPFLRPWCIMNGVYFTTYASANLTELYCKENNLDHRLPTMCITSLVNIAGITYKDHSFIKMFENQVLHIPLRSYLLFGVRDTMTIASTFVIKKDLVMYLHHEHSVPYHTADFVSSLTIPAMAQIFSTPAHILALDLYQRPHATWKDRFEKGKKLYGSVCTGRMMRIIPAFCLGSFLNDMLRSGRYFVD